MQEKHLPIVFAFMILSVLVAWELYKGQVFVAVSLTVAAIVVTYTNLRITDYPYSRRVINIVVFIMIMVFTFILMSWLMP